MPDLKNYTAHLIAHQVSEEFLICHAREEVGSDWAPFSHSRAMDKVRELAAYLGYRLEPVTQEIAPTAQSEPSNVVQIGSDYQRTVDTVASIVGAPQFDGAAS
ncbi:MAG: hypothetical protein J0I08_23490 [Rhizobiales bacterium]|nr:hypothetical protein [Hyphomicrobiales bacterium]